MNCAPLILALPLALPLFAASESAIAQQTPPLGQDEQTLAEAYRSSPTEQNYIALRQYIASEYDQLMDRKTSELRTLESKPDLQKEAAQMRISLERLAQSVEGFISEKMSRYANPGKQTPTCGFVPVAGSRNTYISRIPVTIWQYEQFLGSMSGQEARGLHGKGNDPVTNVSLAEAQSYCDYLSKMDPFASYRLPTEEEWELAAGQMPADASVNCDSHLGVMSVFGNDRTVAASGAIDMWGNAWEMTSTRDEDGRIRIKGGAFDSSRAACQTYNRTQSVLASAGYRNVGFRVVRITNSHNHDSELTQTTTRLR